MYTYISLIIIGAGFMLVVLGFIPEQYQLEPIAKTMLGAVLLVLGVIALVSSDIASQKNNKDEEDSAPIEEH